MDLAIAERIKMKIYLAGYIHGRSIEKCTAWRKGLRDYYNTKRFPIDWLDPLNSGEIGHLDEQGLKSNMPHNMIVHKDYMSVQNADLVIAYLTTFGETRPMMGTFAELAWAWQLHKPTIVVSNETNYIEHPFVKVFASVITPTMESLLENKYIDKFYNAIVSAEYE
jgi:nucleoside 2-deoxyribosyltransferase